jgi:hypothetical protein
MSTVLGELSFIRPVGGPSLFEIFSVSHTGNAAEYKELPKATQYFDVCYMPRVVDPDWLATRIWMKLSIWIRNQAKN